MADYRMYWIREAVMALFGMARELCYTPEDRAKFRDIVTTELADWD